MVRIGDWIEMPKYGADGDVMEINLNTVKVQNWDKTITTIPTYYLITDSFKNWRGMQDSGGRRIKRPIRLKISSIRYLEKAEIEELKKIQLLKPFIEERSEEHTSELQSLMRISYDVFCLKKHAYFSIKRCISPTQNTTRSSKPRARDDHIHATGRKP